VGTNHWKRRTAGREDVLEKEMSRRGRRGDEPERELKMSQRKDYAVTGRKNNCSPVGYYCPLGQMVELKFSRGTNDAPWAPLVYIQLFIVRMLYYRSLCFDNSYVVFKTVFMFYVYDIDFGAGSTSLGTGRCCGVPPYFTLP